jgi:hypothetical protein
VRERKIKSKKEGDREGKKEHELVIENMSLVAKSIFYALAIENMVQMIA